MSKQWQVCEEKTTPYTLQVTTCTVSFMFHYSLQYIHYEKRKCLQNDQNIFRWQISVMEHLTCQWCHQIKLLSDLNWTLDILDKLGWMWEHKCPSQLLWTFFRTFSCYVYNIWQTRKNNWTVVVNMADPDNLLLWPYVKRNLNSIFRHFLEFMFEKSLRICKSLLTVK